MDLGASPLLLEVARDLNEVVDAADALCLQRLHMVVQLGFLYNKLVKKWRFQNLRVVVASLI